VQRLYQRKFLNGAKERALTLQRKFPDLLTYIVMLNLVCEHGASGSERESSDAVEHSEAPQIEGAMSLLGT
jgi:hypothetical protein